MYRRYALFITAIVLALVLTQPAWGQPICDERQAILDRLAQGHGERIVASGVTLNGQVMERLESKDGWKWTLIVTSPAGWTCFVAAGEGWQAVVPVKGEGA